MEQIELLSRRGLVIEDGPACSEFLTAHNYYRFSGYARYFQQAPHVGDDAFRPGVTFDEIRAIYEADEALRHLLGPPLAHIELLLRTHTARVITHIYGPCGRYLEADFYTDIGHGERTVESCLRDIERSAAGRTVRCAIGRGRRRVAR
ncbi:Abi family protein [Nocardia harenae]|uniref:Abi family protein n=1 Tax=Nocardia harenae TaxID=358707 RepID=UPI001FDF21B5|nr:Abi family protein [Nocardia harenae]